MLATMSAAAAAVLSCVDWTAVATGVGSCLAHLIGSALVYPVGELPPQWQEPIEVMSW